MKKYIKETGKTVLKTAFVVGAILTIDSFLPGAGVQAAYTKGTIQQKGQPIIDLIKDVAEFAAYGCYLWAFVQYILGKRAEAVYWLKGITWGLLGVQLLPWFVGIIRSIGE